MPTSDRGMGTMWGGSLDSYHLLLDSAPYGVYRSTLDGRFHEVNAALVQLLGYSSAEELLAVDLTEDLYVHAADRERLVHDAMARYHRDPQRPVWTSAEVSWRRKDGTALVVRLSGTPVRDAAGGLAGFQMMVEDRTEQRHLEQQLRQSQKMEAVGRLTSGIAHDFNNLLSVILGNAHLLTEEVTAGRPDLVEDLEDLRLAAERGVDLVKKLSAFGRNDPLTLRSVDLRAVVYDTMRLLQRALPSTIALRTSLGEDPIRIAGDPGAIEQILLNLANNARDAMPNGGVLEVELRPRRLTAEDRVLHPWVEQGDFVCLTVTDNGSGMGPEARQRIFEPFFTTKARGEGTGLGMAMVYGLVKQHAGYIHLYSELGLGTALRLFFPLAQGERPAIGEGSRGPATIPGGRETVLVAEDEPHLLATARRLLTARGYRVIGASDGVAALDILRARRKEIDLVLSDMVMPRMGGRQLHDILRAQGDQIPVLLTSGYTDATLATDTGARAPIPFLQKPWTAAELLGLVRQVLDGTWVVPE